MNTSKKVFVAAIIGAVVGASATLTFFHRDLKRIGPQDLNIESDLGDVPKMSSSIAGVHRENRYENLHTIEKILALPTNFAQTEALYVLAGRSNSGLVQNLIYEANRNADPLDRGGALDILFFRLTELDPESAVGCELVFKPPLAADTNHGSVFPNDNRPGERSCGSSNRLFRQEELRRALDEHGPCCNIS